MHGELRQISVCKFIQEHKRIHNKSVSSIDISQTDSALRFHVCLFKFPLYYLEMHYLTKYTGLTHLHFLYIFPSVFTNGKQLEKQYNFTCQFSHCPFIFVPQKNSLDFRSESSTGRSPQGPLHFLVSQSIDHWI